MAEQDLPSLSSQAAGELLRSSLSPAQADTSGIQQRRAKLDSKHQTRSAKLKELALQRDKTLSEYSQDAAVALSQGVVNAGATAVSIADLLTQPSETDRIAAEKLGIPQTKSLTELLGAGADALIGNDPTSTSTFQDIADDANQRIEEEFMTEKGQYRTQSVNQALAEREAGSEQRVAKLVEDGFPESIASVVDQAGTAADTLMQYKDNPSLLIDETIKSLPSMLAGGAGAQVSKKAARLLTPSPINSVTTKGIGGAAAAIGTTEGASSSGSTKAEVLKMSEADLYENSEVYSDLRSEDGMGHEDARRYIADKAALRTFAIAAPIAAVAGKLTGAAKFEAELLGGAKEATKGVIKKTVGNVASEAAEEGIQGVSGELAGNIATKTLADESQDITEGTGRALGSGIAVGGTAGGVLGTPRNLVDAGKQAVTNKVIESKEELDKANAAATNGIADVVNEPVETRNITTVLAAIQKRNAVEDVTPEEHQENVDTALTAIKENMEFISQKEEVAEKLDKNSKQQKAAFAELDTLRDRQHKAFEQYKQIQAREQTSVTPEVVQENIESGDAEQLIQSFRTRPESVSKEDVELFYSKRPELTPEQTAIIDAHVNVEESIKDMDAVSADILTGSPEDGFIGIRNYQVDINDAVVKGDTDAANASLKALKTFAERHEAKADTFQKAFNGDEQAIIDAKEIYGAKKGIIPRSKNAKFSARLVERTARESAALNAAVAQAELTVSPQVTQETVSPTVEPITPEATQETPTSPEATPVTADNKLEVINTPPVDNVNVISNKGPSTKGSYTKLYNQIQKEALAFKGTVKEKQAKYRELAREHSDVIKDELIEQIKALPPEALDQIKSSMSRGSMIGATAAISTWVGVANSNKKSKQNVFYKTMDKSLAQLIIQNQFIEGFLEDVAETIHPLNAPYTSLVSKHISNKVREQALGKYGSMSKKELQKVLTTHGHSRVLKEDMDIVKELLSAPTPQAEAVVGIENTNYSPIGVQANPNNLYVFGDNTERYGKGGQAVIRDEPNTIGLATKYTPKRDSSAYFTDDNFREITKIIDEDINNIKKQQVNYSKVIFPKGGLGTGLSDLQNKAPKVWDYLNNKLSTEFGLNYLNGELAIAEATQAKPEVAEAQTQETTEESIQEPNKPEVFNPTNFLFEGKQEITGVRSDEANKNINWLQHDFVPKKIGKDANPNALLDTRDFIEKMAKDPDLIKKYMKDPDADVTPEQKRAIRSIKAFHDQLMTSMKKGIIKTEFKEEFHKNDATAMRLLDPKTGEFPPHVMSAIIMGGYNWMATSAGKTLFNTKEQINKILHRQPDKPVSSEMFGSFGDIGTLDNEVYASIGADIVSSIGIKEAATAPANSMAKLSVSLGMIAVLLMEDAEYITSRAPTTKWITDHIPLHETDALEEASKYVRATFLRVAVVPGKVVNGNQYDEMDGNSSEISESNVDTDGLLSQLFDVQNVGTAPLFEQPTTSITKKQDRITTIKENAQSDIAAINKQRKSAISPLKSKLGTYPETRTKYYADRVKVIQKRMEAFKANPTNLSVKAWHKENDAMQAEISRIENEKSRELTSFMSGQAAIEKEIESISNAYDKSVTQREDALNDEIQSEDALSHGVMQRGTRQEVPTEQLDIIENHAQRALTMKTDLVDKLNLLTEEQQLEAFGYKSDVDTKEHITKRKGIHAKNKAIIRGLTNLFEHSTKAGDKPFWFNHAAWKNQRVGMDSSTFNMQASKDHRHYAKYASWDTEIDISNPVDKTAFLISVAEAFGVKVDKMTDASSLWEITTKLREPQIIEAMDFLDGLSEDATSLIALMKSGQASYILDALNNLSKYRVANKPGGSGKFTSDLFREIDGVNNGVAIGTLQLFAGNNLQDIKEKLNRTGMFFDGVTESFGEYQERKDTNDAYEDISEAWKALMEATSPTIEYTASKVIYGEEIKRGDSKAALMTTVYQAGERGVKETVSDEFITRFYDGIVEAHHEGNTYRVEQLVNALNSIVPNSFDLTKQGTNNEIILEQVIPAKQEKKLRMYIEKVYGEPLIQVMDIKFGDFKQKGKMVNDAMDIAFKAFIQLFDSKVLQAKKQAIKDGTVRTNKSGVAIDDLPKATYNKIMDELREAQPIVHSFFSLQTGNLVQGMQVAKSKKVAQRDDPAYRVDVRTTIPVGKRYAKGASSWAKKSELQAPGKGPIVLMVQSIDAATMMSHLKKHTALNVHDAIIVGQGDADKQGIAMNGSYNAVHEGYSIVAAALETMERSINALEQEIPGASKEIEVNKLKTSDGSYVPRTLGSFWGSMQKMVAEVDTGRTALLADHTMQAQYFKNGSERIITKPLPSNPGKVAIAEVSKVGVEYQKDTSDALAKLRELKTHKPGQLGSTGEGIDPATFKADETIQVDTLDTFQGPLQEKVVRLSPIQVFDKLGNVGSVVESPKHSAELKSLLENVITKVMAPVKLHMQANSQFETIGATNGLDMYIINQSVGAVPGANINGVRMSSQEVYLHELVHNVTKYGINKSTALTRRLMRLWAEAKKSFTVEDFMANPNLADTDPSYAREYQAAKIRYDHIFNPISKAKQFKYNESTGLYDSTERADFLHEFMAFGITNERFRNKLSTLKPNLGADFKNSSNLLEMMSQVLEAIMDIWHNLTVAKGNADSNAQEQLDNMFRAITHVQQQHKVKLFNDLDRLATVTNAKMNSVITASRKQVSKIAKSKVFLESKQPIVRLTGRLTGLIADDRVEYLGKALNDLRNLHVEGKEAMWESIITEVQGRTVDNGVFHDLNRVSNMTVDQQRKHIKTLVAGISEKMYEGHSEGLTEEDKTAITKVLLKTDLVTLVQGRSLGDIQELISSDLALEREIAKITTQLNQFGNLNYFYNRSAASLGHFMATGKVTEVHSLMNASQISQLYGTGRGKPNANWLLRAEPLIDQLATLHALKNTPAQHKTVMSEVMLTEMNNNASRNGVSFTLNMAASLKKDAKAKLFAGHNGMVKGYIKETLNPHIAVEYATEADEAEMNRMGFFRTPGARPIPRDGLDPNQTNIFMYVNRHGGMNRFAAGSVSKSGKKHKGASTYTTRTQAGDPQPGVTGMQDVQSLRANKQVGIDNMFASPTLGTSNTEHMVPLLNNVGKTVGYRYTMAEDTKDNFMEKNNQFQDVLGSTAASIQDKVSSTEINVRIADALKEQFDTDFGANANSFVEIGPNSSDPELRELYYMMPDEMRRHIKATWGGDTIYVKRDQVNMIFGYRKFSITDIWNSDPEDLNGFQRVFIDSMDSIFKVWGGSAYSGIKATEGVWQEVIKDIKDIIVIKTGIVTAVNTLSNTVSLRMLGVPMKDIVRDQAEAFRGAIDYQKDTKELRELEAILSADQRPNRRTLDKERVAILKNQIANNPVRELVESGVYQTIVEDIETEEGEFAYKTGFNEWVGDLTEPLTSKIPQGVKDVAKNVYMSHDSKAYKTFNQAAVLSDFTARYALHKHYTTRAHDKLSSKDAIAKVVSIFIDYDLPTHKSIQYMNDMGVMWFSKYNFRLQKILFETMKENPARVISLLALQGVFGEIPDMYDNSVLTHDMTSMFRNPVNNLDVLGEIAPINLGTSIF